MPENVGESGRGLTILVVDDHDSVRLLLVKALRRRGFNVAEADSGVAALTLLASMEAKLNLIAKVNELLDSQMTRGPL
jgi:CheY-like chemotaxis protein